MRVLHVSTWKAACGIATYADQLVDNLRSCGVESSVFPLHQGEMRSMTPQTLNRLWTAVAQDAKSADLIHLQHEFGIYAPGRSYWRSLGQFRTLMNHLARVDRPVVVTFHTEPQGPPGGRLKTLARRMTMQALWRWNMSRTFNARRGQFQGLLHTRRSMAAYVRSGFDPRTLEVMPHACPVRKDLSHIDSDEARAMLGIGPDRFVLSMFGFVSHYKGYATALRALRTLPEDVVLLVVGGPHPEDAADRTFETLMKARDTLGRDRLIMTGFADKETMDVAHAATDLCIAPYDQGVTLSASGAITWLIASDRPVLASSIPAFLDIQERGRCLALVRPNRPRELEFNIEKLRCDPMERRRLAIQGAEFCAENSWARIARRTADLYSDLLKGANRYRDPLDGWKAMAA